MSTTAEPDKPTRRKPAPPKVTHAIIYARFSPRPDADESQSNEKQIARCREYCEAKGYEIAGVCEDSEKSGADDGNKLDPAAAVAKRKGLLAALTALRRGFVLVVRWRSRLARDVYLEEWLHRMAEAAGARIEAADESNGSDPQQELIRGILAQFRQYEREMIRLRTSRAMQIKQNAGYRMTGFANVPWGWKVDPDDDKRIIPCAEELETAAIIIDLYEDGLTLRKIARQLESLGIKRRGKRYWDHEKVKSILKRQGAL